MRVIILDTETTGKTEPVEPIEVAWLDVTEFPGGGRPLDTASEVEVHRFKPSKPIELGAMATHHIFDRELADCPPFKSSVIGPFDYLIGHMVDYDWKAIGQPKCRRICTDALSRMLYPGLDSYRLGGMAYHLIDMDHARDLQKNAHAADADVYLVYHVLSVMIECLPDIDGWEALWRLSEQARVPVHMPFGKHRGELIADMPSDYKRWLAKQDNVDPYLLKALQA